MQFKLVQYKENMYASFWLVPLTMSLAAMVLAGLLLYLDQSASLGFLNSYLNDIIGHANAQTTLSIIASSVITITSVTFSITVLILSNTSNQLGPRLLPNFMRQKSTQISLGVFIATFIYALIILHFMPMMKHIGVPYLSVSMGLILGIVSFFTLIYFIHFVCHAIQVDNVLTFLTDDLIEAIKRQLPKLPHAHKSINRVVENASHHDRLSQQFKEKSNLNAKHWGYIQTIDYQSLQKLAKEHHLMIHVLHRTGKFVFSDMELFTLYHQQTLDDALLSELHNTIQLGRRRSTVQDIEFAFEELSEVAIHALSPGINNPYTAIHAIDRISEGMSVLAKRAMLPKVLSDEEGQILVVREIVSYQDIVRTTYNRLRQEAKRDLTVAIHILEMFNKLFGNTLPRELQHALYSQAQQLYEDIDQQQLNDRDKEDLNYFFEQLDEPHGL